jgi:DNA (cytosine-5)-methyltransferase 1
MKIHKPKTIDLFAGSGGLSLGLEQAGFQTVFVNEIHPIGLETFLINRPKSLLQNSQNQSLDILEITKRPHELSALASRIREEHGDIDLVTGGPPCQGYSGIGHRRSFLVDKIEIPSNHLYREMAKFIGAIGPKAFIFENVKGLMSARWTPEGEKGEIWRDVLATFERIQVPVRSRKTGYVIQHQLVLSKNYGVPQNRPRVLIVGIREDVFSKIQHTNLATKFFPVETNDFPNIKELWSDLVDPNWMPGGSTANYPNSASTSIQRIFRTTPDGLMARKGAPLTFHSYSKHDEKTLRKFRSMISNDGRVSEEFTTKKFAQRLLPQTWTLTGPTITATSAPDDFVHYCQPRIPTVREWARLQTFPDWYQFAGKRTTGGRRRAGDPSLGIWQRDLPQYTQIGNAVPVKLAFEVGKHLKSLLESSD